MKFENDIKRKLNVLQYGERKEGRRNKQQERKRPKRADGLDGA